jgi:hypothetical protein
MRQFSSLLSWRLFTVQHVSGVFSPIIRNSMTAVAASDFTFVTARARTQHDYHHNTKVKPEAATAVIELLMMGGKTPETCWAVNKRQGNELENCCIWLVIYLNCTMMHGLSCTNLKFSDVWLLSNIHFKGHHRLFTPGNIDFVVDRQYSAGEQCSTVRNCGTLKCI